ncbi:MAG: SUF system NifU family Fe-S cluster assembly protein [Bacteroidetes bacterium]|nr:SUF system NifU family Fe-S cluster assembly protein [Rhodothermia bacterium]MCS7155160.1 SUF system NifU family Fe-S cluster assembly protein [Bacteroidota bacterium]MCX7906213.1 SUF system NifU family Fe-S cluster assembly protein [Bacteroidota bacterium]MDW8138340.1 SUF system NifU family Fe-S cluster assembly protein [Bacteroidota bacterium]MDW8286025.1 SUF system NifU family Fe-S cluster assembly protein [Bacteroidota bacterium]
MDALNELYSELILEHYTKPRNYGDLPEPDLVEEGYNQSCGDRIVLLLQIRDGRIQELRFRGYGCAISIASASLMSQHVKGRSLEEVQQLIEAFKAFVTGKQADLPPALGELRLLRGVGRFPMRVKCATLAWNTLKQALEHPEPPRALPDEPPRGPVC